jgi:cytidine deaminase
MKHKTIVISYTEYDTNEELSEIDAALVDKAREAAKNAWAPYSGFHVGAAVLLDNGKIVIGNNQENAAYPSGLCAERVALFAANANYPRNRVIAMAISATNKKGMVEDPISPCGSCRQSILEAEERFGVPIRLILDSSKNRAVVEGIKNLLPLSFYKDLLQP